MAWCSLASDNGTCERKTKISLGFRGALSRLENNFLHPLHLYPNNLLTFTVLQLFRVQVASEGASLLLSALPLLELLLHVNISCLSCPLTPPNPCLDDACSVIHAYPIPKDFFKFLHQILLTHRILIIVLKT